MSRGEEAEEGHGAGSGARVRAGESAAGPTDCADGSLLDAAQLAVSWAQGTACHARWLADKWVRDMNRREYGLSVLMKEILVQETETSNVPGSQPGS